MPPIIASRLSALISIKAPPEQLTEGIALIVGALMSAAPASAANTICIGEPMSGRRYNHRVSGVAMDSGVGDGCFFAAYGPIGRQIEKVCHIGDIGLDERGDSCRIEAVVAGKVIRRIIKIERSPQH
jgi:hypothetical protein